MKFWEVTIRYDEADEGDEDGEISTIFCKLETKEEEELYDNEQYDELLEGTGYTDEDIYFYLGPDSEDPYIGMNAGDATIIDM